MGPTGSLVAGKSTDVTHLGTSGPSILTRSTKEMDCRDKCREEITKTLGLLGISQTGIPYIAHGKMHSVQHDFQKGIPICQTYW